MLTLSEEQLDVLEAMAPDYEPSPKGGRPPTDKRRALAGIFWVLANGAKWKDRFSQYGTKSSVHRWFLRWVKAGVFEELMRAMGTLVEEDGRFRLYECFVDGTFSKAKGGGDGIEFDRNGRMEIVSHDGVQTVDSVRAIRALCHFQIERAKLEIAELARDLTGKYPLRDGKFVLGADWPFSESATA